MATGAVAAWATALKSNDIPSSVRHAALRSLYNYIGCAIHGSSHPAVTKAHAALEPFFGRSTSSLLGQKRQADAQHAALLNGIASHVHDYDDTHLETIIHPTGPVASAALAYAQYRGDIAGPDLLTAVVAGIEAECKAGLAVWPTHYDVGWHITSTVGSIGAAVAVGKLMGLALPAMEHAIGLAAVQVTGLREEFGTDTKSFHPGRAAQAGLLAALLAEKGYTSSPQTLEAKRGWANVVVAGGKPRLDEFVGQLGSIWETSKNSFKPFPCGIVCHPAIDACVRLRAQQFASASPESIAEQLTHMTFSLKVHPLVIELTSKRTPRDGLEGKFSVFHGCAVALLYGKAGPAQYEDSVVQDASVIAVRDSITAEASDSIRSDEAIVTAAFADGRAPLELHVQHAVGSLQVPLSDAQLRDKFEDQVALDLGPEKAREASEAAWSIVTADAARLKVILSEL